VHAPEKPAPRLIAVRIDQIAREIEDEHWQGLTKTRPLNLP
jgi:hypothetical protein